MHKSMEKGRPFPSTNRHPPIPFSCTSPRGKSRVPRYAMVPRCVLIYVCAEFHCFNGDLKQEDLPAVDVVRNLDVSGELIAAFRGKEVVFSINKVF